MIRSWKNYLFLLLFFLNLSGLSAQDKYPQDYFAPPLDITLYSSGTFGELRGNHFHSGLDIKTQGRVGLPILAAAEGSIVRIKVSPYGFGRALYLKHPNGYTTVYAHLHEFAPEIEAYVVSEMRRKQSNEVDLFPPAGKFYFKQGEEIAKGGNSGGSGGPHLHFEIRDSRTENIINPLLFGLKVEDHRPPEIGPMQVYFFKDGQPAGQKEYSLLNRGEGKYELSGNGIIEAEEELSFGLYAIDKQDKTSNRNGIYELKLFVGDNLEHHFKMETFAFAETRYINAHIDYGLKECCSRSSHRLYLEPGNKLSTYPARAAAGHIKFDRDTIVPIRIEASDVAGNSSVLSFDLHYQKSSSHEATADLAGEANSDINLVEVHYNLPEVLNGEDYELGFKAGSFYRDYKIEIRKEHINEAYSPLFNFGDRSIPVQRYFDIKLRLNHLPKGISPSKLFIASYRDGVYDDYEGGYYQNGWISTRTRQLGQFAIAADTLAPTITASGFSDGSTIKKGTTVVLRVKDDISGVEKYNAWVDEVWVPIYYDAKTNRLLLKTEYWPEAKDSKQVLKLRVEDDRNNQSEEIWELFVS